MGVSLRVDPFPIFRAIPRTKQSMGGAGRAQTALLQLI